LPTVWRPVGDVEGKMMVLSSKEKTIANLRTQLVKWTPFLGPRAKLGLRFAAGNQDTAVRLSFS